MSDDFYDDYDDRDDFTDDVPEEEYTSEEPLEPEIEWIGLNGCDVPSWKDIAFFGVMSEEIAEEQRKIEMLRKQFEDEEDIY
ncbi:hypothetical protein [Desulfobacterium sp. N47]|uniref:Uncharacterized protein n=1 Tax=uncultured Desulfobacterium sp. TaxID=201089 RepID=E1YCX7_9BACT|nr:unknown protein [uncultured Desulfobacterium sp.]